MDVLTAPSETHTKQAWADALNESPEFVDVLIQTGAKKIMQLLTAGGLLDPSDEWENSVVIVLSTLMLFGYYGRTMQHIMSDELLRGLEPALHLFMNHPEAGENPALSILMSFEELRGK